MERVSPSSNQGFCSNNNSIREREIPPSEVIRRTYRVQEDSSRNTGQQTHCHGVVLSSAAWESALSFFSLDSLESVFCMNKAGRGGGGVTHTLSSATLQ